MGNKRIRIAAGVCLWALFALIVALMFGFSGQSGAESRGVSMGLAQWVLDHCAFIRIDVALLDHILRKTAHFCLFAAEGFFLYSALRASTGKAKAAFFISASASALVAVLNELHQLLDIERSCQVSDMLLDFSGSITGILAAMALCAIVKRLLRRR